MTLSLGCSWLPAGMGADRYELMLMETLWSRAQPIVCPHTANTGSFLSLPVERELCLREGPGLGAPNRAAPLSV